MKNVITLIKIILTDFAVKEMCLQNPRKSPAEPSGSTEHILNTSG